jgi:hypothetical protein
MSRRWLPRSGVAALAAVAVAGCGSGSLSTAQLRSRATKICTVAARRLNRIATPTSPSEGTAFLTRGLAVIDDELAALHSLHGTGTFGRAVDGTAAELAALRFTLKGLRADNDPVVTIKTLQQRLTRLEAHTNAAWRSLDVPACVNG